MTSGNGKQPVFAAKNLTCVRGGKVLFERLSFRLTPSEALVVTGPNGSGKTSLLRVLTGLLDAEAGEFSWQGETSGRANRLVAGSVHYLGHTAALKPFLTVRENLFIWSRLYGDGTGVEEAAEKTGVAGFLEFPAKYLSEGQRKRVNLARFLTTHLLIWVMDEPTAGLDTDGHKLLSKLVAGHLKDDGIAIIATHQDLGLAEAKTLHLENGKARWAS